MDAMPEEIEELLRRLSADPSHGAASAQDLDPAHIARLWQQYPYEMTALVAGAALTGLASGMVEFIAEQGS